MERKVRFEVRDGYYGGFRFEDQSEAVRVAKQCKRQDTKKLVTITKITWENRRIVGYETVAVTAAGTYERI